MTQAKYLLFRKNELGDLVPIHSETGLLSSSEVEHRLAKLAEAATTVGTEPEPLYRGEVDVEDEPVLAPADPDTLGASDPLPNDFKISRKQIVS